MAATITKFPAIINGISIGNTGIPIIINAKIGEAIATVTAERSQRKIQEETKIKFTQDPVTNCPKGLVIACTDTSNAIKIAVCVIHKMCFVFIINPLAFFFIIYYNFLYDSVATATESK